MPPPVGPQKKGAGCELATHLLCLAICQDIEVQIHGLALPATRTASGLGCCSKGAVSCPHSSRFWTLLSRQGTFMGKLKSSRHKQENKTTTKLLNPTRPQKQGPQHQKFKLWLVSPAGN